MDDTRKTMQWLKSIKEKYIHGGDDGYDDKRRQALDESIRVMGLLANGVTVQRWIPVAERLPEEDGEYLVWFGRNVFESYAEVRYFAKDGEAVDKYDLRHEKNVWYYYDSEWGYVACRNVTHWMPLPEPPKEDESDA